MSESLLLARRDPIARAEPRRSLARRVAAWIAGVAGLLAYNWWALVPLKPGLLRSPDEFFSNLEVTGHPYATVMQRADVLSGALLLAAFLVVGSRSVPGGRREWLGMVVFAIGAGLGGLFPQVCTDGISATCLSLEWQFKLPASQYVHDGAGILEFAGITFALGCAVLRTRGDRTGLASIYRRLAIAAAVAYPFLFLSYLLDLVGCIMEALFFVGITVMAAIQLAERTRRRPHRRASLAQSAGGAPPGAGGGGARTGSAGPAP